MTRSEVKAAALGWLPDALLLAGAGAAAYGAWLIYSPAGYIAAGLALCGYSLIVSKGAR